MKLKIWKVEFGGWTEIDVVARNAKDAIKRAIYKKRQEADVYCRLQDITSVELIASED